MDKNSPTPPNTNTTNRWINTRDRKPENPSAAKANIDTSAKTDDKQPKGSKLKEDDVVFICRDFCRLCAVEPSDKIQTQLQDEVLDVKFCSLLGIEVN